MIICIILRLAYILSMTPNLMKLYITDPLTFEYLLTVIGSLELIRRGIWNFFIVECEQIKNRDIHKAVDDFDLPFKDFLYEIDKDILL